MCVEIRSVCMKCNHTRTVWWERCPDNLEALKRACVSQVTRPSPHAQFPEPENCKLRGNPESRLLRQAACPNDVCRASAVVTPAPDFRPRVNQREPAGRQKPARPPKHNRHAARALREYLTGIPASPLRTLGFGLPSVPAGPVENSDNIYAVDRSTTPKTTSDTDAIKKLKGPKEHGFEFNLFSLAKLSLTKSHGQGRGNRKQQRPQSLPSIEEENEDELVEQTTNPDSTKTAAIKAWLLKLITSVPKLLPHKHHNKADTSDSSDDEQDDLEDLPLALDSWEDPPPAVAHLYSPFQKPSHDTPWGRQCSRYWRLVPAPPRQQSDIKDPTMIATQFIDSKMTNGEVLDLVADRSVPRNLDPGMTHRTHLFEFNDNVERDWDWEWTKKPREGYPKSHQGRPIW